MDVISIASDVFVTFGSVKSGKLSRCDYRNTMAPKLLIQACVSVSLRKLKASRYAASSCRPRAAGNPLIWRHADGSGTRAAALARRFVHQGCGIVQARCQSNAGQHLTVTHAIKRARSVDLMGRRMRITRRYLATHRRVPDKGKVKRMKERHTSYVL